MKKELVRGNRAVVSLLGNVVQLGCGSSNIRLRLHTSYNNSNMVKAQEHNPASIINSYENGNGTR